MILFVHDISNEIKFKQYEREHQQLDIPNIPMKPPEDGREYRDVYLALSANEEDTDVKCSNDVYYEEERKRKKKEKETEDKPPLRATMYVSRT